MKTLEERFFEKVHFEPNTGCWLWAGDATKGGYGRISQKARMRVAAHVALELHGRHVPSGMQACHHCDFTSCVNPAHLFVGTQKDSAQNCVSKGRPVGAPRKGVCFRGHALTGDNLYWSGGHRRCKACVKMQNDARKQRFLAEGLTTGGTIRKGCGA